MTARRVFAQAPVPVLTEQEQPDLCPFACRALWAAVIYDQWRIAFPSVYVTTSTAARRADAVKWLRGADCKQICELIGIVPEFLHRRLDEALAGIANGTRAPSKAILRQINPRSRLRPDCGAHAGQVIQIKRGAI